MRFNYSILLLAAAFSLTPLLSSAQTIKPLNVVEGKPEALYGLSYRGTTLDQVLEIVRKITGRTIIMDPKVSPITVNLVSEKKLAETDVLIAIETMLEMNNIVLIPQGDEFIQVVPADAAFQRPLEPNYNAPVDQGDKDESRLVSQVIPLAHVTVEEVQPILQLMLHPFAKVQFLERANAIMIVDSAYNINRVVDILKYIDKPNLRTEEPKIYQVKHAQATEVAAKITELIAESQAEAANARPTTSTLRAPTPTTNRSTPAGVIRARTTPATPAATQASFNLASSDAEKGLINGKVQIVPDERTNIIIIISRPENFPFFDQMIEVLDVKVEPEITFKNVRLEFAIAEDIAGLINELIGAATSESTSSAAAGATANNNRNDSNSSTQARSIRDFIQSRNTASSTSNAARSTNNANNPNNEGNLGEISESTQVIADPRTNSIMIMGRKSDIALLSEVIKEVDIMLDQVLIEAVILEVSLNDNLSYGVDWLQRSLTVVDQQVVGPRGGITTTDDIAAFGSASRQNNSSFIDGATVDRTTEFPDGALSIFGSYYDLNLDAVLTLAASDSDARVLSTPVILTTDNTEANIVVGERRPIPTSTSQGINTGVSQTNVDYENIGIELKVTPRINPQGFVVMEIEQSADNVGGNVVISGDEFPIITTRQLNGSIAVQDRQTIVLGGLVSEDTRDSTTKVPILGDLPFAGSLFRSQRNENNRTELLVLITPYVVGSSIDALNETKRLAGATKLSDETWHRQWSDSPLNPDKDAAVPISRFRDRFSLKKKSLPAANDNEVELPAIEQVQEVSRFQRPLLQKEEAVSVNNEDAAVDGSWKISTGPSDQTTLIPEPDTPKPEISRPVPQVNRPAPPALNTPKKTPPSTRVAPAPAIPAPAIPAPAIPAPVKKPVAKSYANQPAGNPLSLAENPAVQNVTPKKPAVRELKSLPQPAAIPAPKIKPVPPKAAVRAPAISITQPKVNPAPPRAMNQQSGQRLILNAKKEGNPSESGKQLNSGQKPASPAVGDAIKTPEKKDSTQADKPRLRGLFSLLR